jgi:hypothetical protein
LSRESVVIAIAFVLFILAIIAKAWQNFKNATGRPEGGLFGNLEIEPGLKVYVIVSPDDFDLDGPVSYWHIC